VEASEGQEAVLIDIKHRGSFSHRDSFSSPVFRVILDDT
jgi:hypothetical protein